MAQFEKRFVQDLTQDIKIQQGGTIVFNNDNLSNVVGVALYNGKVPASVSGTVVGAVIAPDGATVPVDNGTISGNTVSITLTRACFALPGNIGVGIQVVTGDVATTVLKVIYNVELFSTDTIVDPDSRITLSLAEIQAKLDEIPTILANAQTAIDGIEAQKDTMIASIASVAGQGTDTTLTQSGVAADAKATGDQVRDLKSAVTPVIISHPSTDYYFRIGGLTSAGETNDSNDKRVRSNWRYFARKGSTISANDGWQFNIALYATEEISSFISGSYVSFSANQYTFADDSYFMVSIKNTDERAFTTDTIIDAVNGIEFNIIGVNWLPPCITHDFSRILPPYMPDVLSAKLSAVHWNPNALNWQQGDPATPIFKGAHDRVIEKYDELMNDWCPPDYTIDKTRLGSDASGTIYLWRYDFYPSVPVTNNAIVNDSYHTYTDDDYPVVIMDSGIHGNEKPSVYALLNLMYEIVTAKDNDIFGWLHNHIHFVIVPFVNPYGFEYDTRYNSNHVDLNRNFLAYWGWNSTSSETDPQSSNYRGTGANSEAETKLINAILKEYQNKAVLYYSWHTHGVFTAYNTMTCYAIPQSTLYDRMQNIGYQLISGITNSAHTNHEVSAESGYIGELETESYKGYTAYTGLYYGIPSAVPECMHRIYDGQSGTKLTDNNANCLNVEYMLYSVGLALKSLLY